MIDLRRVDEIYVKNKNVETIFLKNKKIWQSKYRYINVFGGGVIYFVFSERDGELEVTSCVLGDTNIKTELQENEYIYYIGDEGLNEYLKCIRCYNATTKKQIVITKNDLARGIQDLFAQKFIPLKLSIFKNCKTIVDFEKLGVRISKSDRGVRGALQVSAITIVVKNEVI